MTLLRVPPSIVEAVARQLRITDHRTGATLPWVPNDEQRRFWRACNDHPWVFAAKPRRIGLTTAGELDDLLWCLANDTAGNRVRCGLFVDADDKSKERVAFAESIVEQPKDDGTEGLGPVGEMFRGCDVNSDRVLFPRGSVLEFHTGSGKNAGRGGGYQRLHLTELPFWLNGGALGALLPSLSMDVGVIIETTLDMAGPNAIPTRRIWRDPANAYERLFFSVEEHLDYRAPADRITDDQWVWAQNEGYADREAAAWFLSHCVPNLMSSDLAAAFREFPQLERHMFSTASGLWFKHAPEVIEPKRVIDIEGHQLLIYRDLAETSGQIAIGVDVAKGSGFDASSIAVIDKRGEGLVAMLHDNTILTTALARALKVASDLYTVPPRALFAGLVVVDGHSPDIDLESNGVGTGPIQHARELGLAVRDVHVPDASVIYDVLLLAKEAVEEMGLAGPAELAIEADELHRHPVTGKWIGAKDGMVAYGHARRRARLDPYVEPKRVKDSRKVDVEAILAANNQEGSDW